MPEPVESVEETPKPLINLLVGIGIPLAIIAAGTAAGVLLALSFGGGGRDVLLTGAYFGALLGFFASLYGVAELLIACFFSSGPSLNRVCRAAGYLAIWSVAVSVILWLR